MIRPELLDLSRHIYDVPDFPKQGIIFKDITPLLREPAALSLAVELLTQPYRDRHVDVVVGTESRGFIFGTAVARNLSAGFVPVRKKGKLPRATRVATYDLEYGTDTLEVHEDAIRDGDKVIMVDDLLATGGTMSASCELIESLGGQIVGLAVLIELMDLNGRERLRKYPIHAIMQVHGEKVATM